MLQHSLIYIHTEKSPGQVITRNHKPHLLFNSLILAKLQNHFMDETSDTGSKSGTLQAIPGQLALIVEYEVSSLTTHSDQLTGLNASANTCG